MRLRSPVSRKALIASLILASTVAMPLGAQSAYLTAQRAFTGDAFGVADSAESSTPQTDESAIMRYLQPALDAGTSVRLSYAASCNATSGFPPIPPIGLSAPSNRLTGVNAVRSIFDSDHNVVVTKGPDGIAKVSIGKVPTDLLRTRVALLRLQPIEQYNPGNAIDALESTKELKSAVKSLGLFVVAPLGIQLLYLPVPGDDAPHVPAVLHDVTIDQVLDLVAKTFRSVVTYGVCTSGPAPRSILISLISPSQ